MPSIESIEGIGKAKAKKLRAAGIRTTNALLDTGASKSGRRALASLTGFAETTILEWVNRADLMRVKGIGEQYSDLLEAAGVDSVKELAQRNVANLAAALANANARGRQQLVNRVPGERLVHGWVKQAKKMTKVVTH